MMHKPKKSSRAFTLFELILVMFIIALTVALAAPSLANFARTRLVADTAAHFTAVASHARNRAVADGKIHRLTIDTTARQFSLSIDTGDGQTFTPSDHPDAKPFTLPKDLQIETDAPELDGKRIIDFHPEGRTDTATITFSDNHNNSTTVTCDSPFSYYKITTGPDAQKGPK
jgi:type II secretion system protein H